MHFMKSIWSNSWDDSLNLCFKYLAGFCYIFTLSLYTFCLEMTVTKEAQVIAAVIVASITHILIVVAIILIAVNVMANETSIDANKHQLVSCFWNWRDVTNNMKNQPVIT